jgi:hypothetical protein
VNGSEGVYYINFGQDVTHCVALAAQGSIPNFAGAGLATAAVPGPAFVSVSSAGSSLATGFPSLSSIAVQTRRTSGALASASFTVAVFC